MSSYFLRTEANISFSVFLQLLHIYFGIYLIYNLKFYKITAVPVLLYDSETWTVRKRDWNIIQAAEMKYLRAVERCTRLDQIRNGDIKMSWVFPL
jgi:ABC-type transport system involved in Fe-S cluster assembly fused permease/ATPase subunit